MATSISHDSHNIIVVGTNEEDMAVAANRIVEQHGGITVVENGQVQAAELLLAIAGIMSDDTLINGEPRRWRTPRKLPTTWACPPASTHS